MNTLTRAGNFISKTIANVVWQGVSSGKPAPCIYELHHRVDQFGPEHPEFIRILEEPASIEPIWGYVITDRGVLLKDSMQPNFLHDRALWRVGTPSVLGFAKKQLGREKRIRHYPAVIDLRHFWEWNYYHFYFDVLGRLSLLNDYGIDFNLPIVLGRYAMELPWVKGILSQGKMRQYNWIIPDNEYIHADRIIYCSTQQPYKHKMDYVLSQMSIQQPDPGQNRRVFLNRSQNGFRHLVNLEEILPILEDFGFEVADAAGMTVPEQIKLFNTTRYLVAIHGAGVSNIIFRRDGLLFLLELHAKGFISDDFKRTCNEYDYCYDTLDGDPRPGEEIPRASFTVSPARLRKKLELMFLN